MENKQLTIHDALESMNKVNMVLLRLDLNFTVLGEITHIGEHLKSFTSEYQTCWKCKRRLPLSFFRYNKCLQTKCMSCKNMAKRPPLWAKLTNQQAHDKIIYIIEELNKLEDLPDNMITNAHSVKDYFEQFIK